VIRLEEIERDIKAWARARGLRHLADVEIAVVYNPRSRSRAVARMWGLNRVFQLAYGMPPLYVLELLEAFFHMSCQGRARVLAHELAHVPSTASGALRPHNKAFWRDYRRYAGMMTCDDFPSLRLISPRGV